MNPEELDYGQELEVAFEAAEEAAKVIESYSGRVEVRGRKGSFNDIVTEADEKCQEKIEAVLSDYFPEDGLKAEEMKGERRSDRMWVVDPIDGTSNFLKGFEYYCTSIALKQEDEVKVGVVLSPESGLDRTWFGVKGGGAFVTEDGFEAAERIEVSDQADIKGSLIDSKRKSEVEGQEEFDTFVNSELVKNDAMIRITDAGALSCARVAEGVFDGFISGIENEWDYLAGKLLVKEANGAIRDRESIFPDRTEVVASNGRIQEGLEEIVDNYRETGK